MILSRLRCYAQLLGHNECRILDRYTHMCIRKKSTRKALRATDWEPIKDHKSMLLIECENMTKGFMRNHQVYQAHQAHTYDPHRKAPHREVYDINSNEVYALQQALKNIMKSYEKNIVDWVLKRRDV